MRAFKSHLMLGLGSLTAVVLLASSEAQAKPPRQRARRPSWAACVRAQAWSILRSTRSPTAAPLTVSCKGWRRSSPMPTCGACKRRLRRSPRAAIPETQGGEPARALLLILRYVRGAQLQSRQAQSTMPSPVPKRCIVYFSTSIKKPVSLAFSVQQPSQSESEHMS